MKLGSMGEFGLIERFAPVFMKHIPEGTLGIGDDCAVIPLGSGKKLPEIYCSEDTTFGTGAADAENSGSENSPASGECLLVTTDLLLENVHFLKDRISAEDLGFKSLAVNLSDIAGMGGTPLFAFLSIGLPAETEISWTDDFFKGFNRLAEETGTLLMGGDTAGSKDGIVINVAVIGKSDLSGVKYRSGAEAGDYICITGLTGESAAGLQIVLDSSLEKRADSILVQKLLESHNTPRPHIKEGLFLSREEGVHAMMDVSDGIDSDLRHIMKKSHCSAVIDLDSFPLSRNLEAAEKEMGIDPYLSALAGGEDYCLLIAVDSELYDSINRRFEEIFGRPLYRIGRTFSSSAAEPAGSDSNGKNKESAEKEQLQKDYKLSDKNITDHSLSVKKAAQSSCRLVYIKGGKETELTKRGFDHFSK